MVQLIFGSGYCMNRGSLHFESKEAWGGIPKSMWDTYSAFANTEGGTMVLGLRETPDGLIIEGVPNADEDVQAIWNTINNKQKVSVNVLEPDGVRVETVDGKDIIVVEVPRADRHDKPVYIDDNMRNTYRRRGEGDYRCDHAQIKSMVMDSTDGITDNQPVTCCEVRDLINSTLHSFRRDMNTLMPGNEWANLDDEEFLRRLGAIRRVDGGMIPTVAGLLVFGNEYHISLEMNNYFLDYREYDDDSDEWRFRVVSGTPGWSGNIYDFYTTVIGRIRARTPRRMEVGRDLRRVEATGLDKALREAVLNALIHADYHGRTGVVIESRIDSVDIINPGSFRIPIPEAEAGGVSDPRNKTVAKIMSLVGGVERAGRGVRLMYAGCGEVGLPKPLIAEMFEPDRVRVRFTLVGDGRSNEDLQGEVLRMISEDPRMSIVRMSKVLGIGRARVEAAVRGLKERGVLAREGGNRGRWAIINPLDR